MRHKIAKENIEIDRLISFITDRKYHYIRHILSIIILFILMWIGKKKGDYQGLYDQVEWIVSLLIILILYYINLYFLIPKLLFKGKLFLYFLFLLVSVFVGAIVSFCFHDIIIGKYKMNNNLNSNFFQVIPASIFLVILISLSSSIKFFQKWISDWRTIQMLEKKSFEIEMTILKNQIQPHFLFNMLNNIKIMIKRDPDQASYIVDKLSDFLRYLLYENSEKENYILLQSEVKFLADYLALEKIRRENFTYNFSYNVGNVFIPKNILLILVENAVKHSKDHLLPSFIEINIALIEKYIIVTITNSIPNSMRVSTEIGGIGLNNLRRRLHLLYNNDFRLVLENKETFFLSTLKIPYELYNS